MYLSYTTRKKAGDCSILLTVNSNRSNLCTKYINVNRYNPHKQKENSLFLKQRIIQRSSTHVFLQLWHFSEFPYENTLDSKRIRASP